MARHRHVYAKAGEEVVEWDQARKPVSDEEITRLFVHQDGRIRVPVLCRDALLIRGYTPELYTRLLAAPSGN